MLKEVWLASFLYSNYININVIINVNINVNINVYDWDQKN